METQTVKVLEVEITLDCVDGSQYYSGHGHASSSDNLIACLLFDVPVCRVEDKEEMLSLIMSSINQYEFNMFKDNEISINVNDDDIIKQISDNDLTFYMKAFNDIMDDIDDQLIENESESDDQYEMDMALYGWIHIYENEIVIKQPIINDYSNKLDINMPEIKSYKFGSDNRLDKILKGEI